MWVSATVPSAALLLAPERGKSDGVIYPKADWKGFIPDMIDQISELGNFTYELFLPSGTGFVLLIQTRVCLFCLCITLNPAFVAVSLPAC